MMAQSSRKNRERHSSFLDLRWWIAGLLFASTAINYIDRQTLSVLAPYLKIEFHWTNSDFALILIAFRIAYALGETASGRFLDWLGTRVGLLITVSWYSLAAMVTGLAVGLRSFVFFDSSWVSANLPIGPALRRRSPSGFRNQNAAGLSPSSIAAPPSVGPSFLSLSCGSTTNLERGAPCFL